MKGGDGEEGRGEKGGRDASLLSIRGEGEGTTSPKWDGPIRQDAPE